jgi:cell division protein FtsQ
MWNDIKFLNATANILFGVCVLLLVLAGLWVLINRPMFTLNEIEVEGLNKADVKHVNAEIIRSTALPKMSGNFFTANLDTVRNAFELVPWVRNASVRRGWPNKLIVTLEEHTPLGTWGEDGQLLSTKGDIFIANLAEAEEDTDLLEFSGPVGSEKEVLAHYLDFKNWFKAVSLEPIEVNYSKRYAWLVKLDNGLIVQLGREDSSAVLKERVERLLQVYPELNNRLQGKIESVDLRYSNGLALKTNGQELGVDSKVKKQKS